jgi:predicted membrane-bound dolichyl-phosphate-mannose-protein mannosyltransferase
MARTLEEAEKIISLYEQNGVSKLYYALNRKANEMADIMNKNNLANLSLDDPKDKTFERLKVIWNDASSLAVSIESLGSAAGITGDEDKDIKRARRATTPETMAQQIGDYKTQDV